MSISAHCARRARIVRWIFAPLLVIATALGMALGMASTAQAAPHSLSWRPLPPQARRPTLASRSSIVTSCGSARMREQSSERSTAAAIGAT
jgi:hypothetical protein